MSRSRTTETVEEFLARGGEIQEIPQGVTGDVALKFNNVPLDQRIRWQKKKTYQAAQNRLQKQDKRR